MRLLASEELIVANHVEIEFLLPIWRKMGVSMLSRCDDQNQDTTPQTFVYTLWLITV